MTCDNTSVLTAAVKALGELAPSFTSSGLVLKLKPEGLRGTGEVDKARELLEAVKGVTLHGAQARGGAPSLPPPPLFLLCVIL